MGGFVSADGRAASRGRVCSARGAKERLRAAPSPARGFLRLLSLVCFFFLPFPSGIGAVGPRVLTVARRGGGGKERSGAQRTAARAGLRAPLLGAQSCAAAARLVPEPPLCSEPFVRRVRGPSEPFRAPPPMRGDPRTPRGCPRTAGGVPREGRWVRGVLRAGWPPWLAQRSVRWGWRCWVFKGRTRSAVGELWLQQKVRYALELGSVFPARLLVS